MNPTEVTPARNEPLEALLTPEGVEKVRAAENEIDEALVSGGEALARLERRVRQATLGSRKGPSPTPIPQSPRKKRRLAVRAARKLNR